MTRSKVWAIYTNTMRVAEQAALSFADALELYLRKGVHSPGFRYLDAACAAANMYMTALRRAEPFHVGALPEYCQGHVINWSEDEMLAAMRELRGTAVYRRLTHPDGSSKMVPRYADDGIAGFFRQEVKSMKPFGSPRRMPTKEELANVHDAA